MAVLAVLSGFLLRNRRFYDVLRVFYGGSVDCLLDRNNGLKALSSGQCVGIVSENNDILYIMYWSLCIGKSVLVPLYR